MGRGRIILRGGNRGIEPLRSGVAERYGDLSDRGDRSSARLCGPLKPEDHEMSGWVADVASGVPLMRAKARRFSRCSDRGSRRYCLRQHQPEDL